MQRDLPTPPEHFSAKKAKILSHLSVPDAEYSDASPKGTVDEGIRDLIAQINCVDGFVTTSSCAGRVSVFVEGRKTVEAGHDGQVAGVGGKGAGGAWLLVSHQPVASGPDDDGWIKSLQLNLGEDEAVAGSERSATAEHRLIHFKFEPMVRRACFGNQTNGAKNMANRRPRYCTFLRRRRRMPNSSSAAHCRQASASPGPSISHRQRTSSLLPWSRCGPWDWGSSPSSAVRSAPTGSSSSRPTICSRSWLSPMIVSPKTRSAFLDSSMPYAAS